jgi:hypothetical protein
VIVDVASEITIATPGGGTRMSLRNRGTPAGFLRLVAPFIALVMRRANRKDLARLKSLLEGKRGRIGPESPEAL